MGPPFEYGGEGGRRGRRGELQWGRRSNTAESVYTDRFQRDAHLASMGPPFEYGGELWANDWPTLLRSRFNGAAVRIRRRASARRPRADRRDASMGPPFEYGGEDALRQAHNGEILTASMGPPFEYGGELSTWSPVSSEREASMGPPFEYGGETRRLLEGAR